jgi:hypothetical protein
MSYRNADIKSDCLMCGSVTATNHTLDVDGRHSTICDTCIEHFRSGFSLVCNLDDRTYIVNQKCESNTLHLLDFDDIEEMDPNEKECDECIDIVELNSDCYFDLVHTFHMVRSSDESKEFWLRFRCRPRETSCDSKLSEISDPDISMSGSFETSRDSKLSEISDPDISMPYMPNIEHFEHFFTGCPILIQKLPEPMRAMSQYFDYPDDREDGYIICNTQTLHLAKLVSKCYVLNDSFDLVVSPNGVCIIRLRRGF